jgi:FMN phosphatase YigB (HAD superfamily)
MSSSENLNADTCLTGDARLVEAVKLLEQGSFEVLSLDIFDTLLWRTVPEPVDAFVLLGRHLLDAGRLDPAVSPQLFARLRERAEWKARDKVARRGRAPEVSLDQIYAELPGHLVPGGRVEELEVAEVAFERTITFPDLDVVAVAEWARTKLESRLVLASDTYFSEQQLRELLAREPFAALGVERIFASSQYGIGKGSGLYGTLVRELGVDPGAVLHIGDNLAADVEHARANGIRAVHFDKFPGTLRGVLEDEGLCRRHHDRQEAKPALDERSGDFGFTAMRSKTLSRIAGIRNSAADPYWRFGASVLGPVFVAFGEWIHRRAQDQGVNTVYCMMREGEFLTRLVNGARAYLDSPVRAQPIWLSRQVCARAAVSAAGRDELARFLERRVPPTVEHFCRSIGIGMEHLTDAHTEAHQRLDDPELIERVLAHVADDPTARNAVRAGTARLRTRLVDYVLATVDDRDRPVVLVDLGWGGTIQAYLDQALHLGGASMRTVGLYLLTNDGVLDRMLAGLHAEGFLASGGLPPDASWVIRCPEILEQVCMHDEGSLVDFDDDARPVLGPPDHTASQALQRTAVQAGILAFQQEWGRYSTVVPPRGRRLDNGRSQLTRMLTRFIVRPTPEETTLFAGWAHDQGFGSSETEALVVPETARTLRHMTVRHLLDVPMTKAYWTFALASMYSPRTAMCAAAVADGGLPIEALDPTQPCDVRVLVDRGPGFHDAASVFAGPNTDGLCYARAEVSGRPIRGVMVRVGDGTALLRVDSIRIVLSRQGEPDPTVVALTGADDVVAGMFRGGRALSTNVLLAHAARPEVVYSCPPEWGSSVYKVEVEMAFAWIPLPPLPSQPAGNVEVLLHAASLAARRARRLWTSAARDANDRFRPRA